MPDRASIEELEERLALLRSLLVDINVQPPFEWGLTPTQTLLFGALVNRESCTVGYLAEIMAERSGIGAGTRESVFQTVCVLRRKLRPFGIMVGKSYASGYSLDAATRAKYRTPRRTRLDAFLKGELALAD